MATVSTVAILVKDELFVDSETDIIPDVSFETKYNAFSVWEYLYRKQMPNIVPEVKVSDTTMLKNDFLPVQQIIFL